MASTGRPKKPLSLTDDERAELNKLVRAHTTPQRLAQRARIVLECDEGHNNTVVATTLGINQTTVGKWRNRYIQLGLDGLNDADRPGVPRKYGDAAIEDLITKTLETMPRGASRWSTRKMASQAGMSRQTVSRVWRAFGLKPHRREGFQLSKDPYFVDKVRDVAGLYMRPPENALVLCVDEKSQIQALNRTQPLLPLKPGQAERGTPEYQRNGTTSLFAALDVATGNVIGKCFRRHRSHEFVKFLTIIDKNTPADRELHLILDNYATHKPPAVKEWLLRHPRFHLHFIPTHSSWLNQVEIWFGILTAQQIKRGSHHSVRELETAIKEFVDVWDENPKPFEWTRSG